MPNENLSTDERLAQLEANQQQTAALLAEIKSLIAGKKTGSNPEQANPPDSRDAPEGTSGTPPSDQPGGEAPTIQDLLPTAAANRPPEIQTSKPSLKRTPLVRHQSASGRSPRSCY